MCLLGSLATPAWGHARFKLNAAFKARNDATGLKTAPCGGIARTDNPTILKAGQTVNLEWEETINHPGYYIIRFSPADDVGFEQNVLVDMHIDDQNETPTPHPFEAQIQVPNVECEACTLQMIQVMEDRDPPTNYYSCADIQIKAADDPTVTPPAAPSGLNLQVNE
jgi:hypothetical protein